MALLEEPHPKRAAIVQRAAEGAGGGSGLVDEQPADFARAVGHLPRTRQAVHKHVARGQIAAGGARKVHLHRTGRHIQRAADVRAVRPGAGAGQHQGSRALLNEAVGRGF